MKPFVRLLPPPALALALSVALAATLFAGCSSVGVKPQSPAELRRTVAAHGVDPTKIVVPYELTPEIRQWTHDHTPTKGTDQERLTALIRSLLTREGRGIVYERGFTGTAAQVWARRSANCLGFTNLFLGMVRELGLPAYYLRIEDIEAFEKEGDLVVVSGHVTAGLGSAKDRKVLEFNLDPNVDYRRTEPLPDLTALALYYSNRGAELLRTGDVDDALQRLEIAVRLDPKLPAGWANRGVALRRKGDMAGAEASYRKALEADPNSATAYYNLASLVRLRGNEAEAKQLLELANRLGSRNPFGYLNLGDLSMSHGDLEEAHDYYRKALRLYKDHAEPYAALGLWELANGDTKQAERWLHRARAIDPTVDRVQLLASRLGDEEPIPKDFARLISSKKKGKPKPGTKVKTGAQEPPP